MARQCAAIPDQIAGQIVCGTVGDAADIEWTRIGVVYAVRPVGVSSGGRRLERGKDVLHCLELLLLGNGN